VKATKTSGGGSASPSYNPPRDCNISSYAENQHPFSEAAPQIIFHLFKIHFNTDWPLSPLVLVASTVVPSLVYKIIQFFFSN